MLAPLKSGASGLRILPSFPDERQGGIPSIGIVGTGIAGLTLALQLQRHGVHTTVYSEHGPGDLRGSTLPSAVARFGATQARERALGVDHWSDARHSLRALHLHVGDGLKLSGRLADPLSAIDFRIYLPRLLEDYERRGGRLVIAPEHVTAWSEHHDLMVVASESDLFPRDPARSPYAVPRRRIAAGLYRGIRYADPEGLIYAIAPGAGEVFTMPFLTFEGWVSALVVEAVPGGPLEQFTRLRSPAGHEADLLRLLELHAPAIAARVDRGRFTLTRKQDMLQGAITPTVRQPWARLETGRYALALGDAWTAIDPIVAQGANLGSESAWIAGDAIHAHAEFDERFRRDVAERFWAAAQPAVALTDAFLAPPPHLLEVLEVAASDERVANAFAARFARPAELWRRIATPAQAAAFLASARAMAAQRA